MERSALDRIKEQEKNSVLNGEGGNTLPLELRGKDSILKMKKELKETGTKQKRFIRDPSLVSTL